MSNPEETFLLVEIDTIAIPSGLREIIIGVVRTYLSNSRALDDLALLQETQATARYKVISAPHIDE